MASKRILLLDDSPAVHLRVRKAFAGSGVDVTTTDSWVDTKNALFAPDPPDLLLLDLQMPTIDGAAVGRALRRRMDVPIVIFSSESPERLRAAGAAFGANAVVPKSGTDRELVSTVMGLLHMRRYRSEDARPEGDRS